MCVFIYFYIATMNKLFKKTLALLAVAVLAGQTMFTSIVNAVEAEENDNFVGEENVVSEKADVVESSEVKVIPSENLETLSDVTPIELKEIDLDNVKAVDMDVSNSETAAGIDERDNNEWQKCTTDLNKLQNLANKLDSSSFMPEWVSARVNDWVLYLYTESGIINFTISDVTTLIDYLLGKEIWDDNWGFIWKIMNDGEYYTSISNVTQLIDVILNGGLKDGDEIVVSTRNDCFNLKVVKWIPEDSCNMERVAYDVAALLNNYFKNNLGKNDIIAYVNRSWEIVISYENSNGLISYVTALIDYILASWNLPIDSNQMKLWDMLWQKYQLDISTVTALIDLSLSDEAQFGIKLNDNNCSTKYVLVKFQKSEPGSNWNNWGNETCSTVNVKGWNLKQLADNLNQGIVSKWVNWFVMSYDDSTLYLGVKDWSKASFDISTVTSLIDYLLTDRASDLEGWWYIWQSMKDAWFSPNISNVTELIDFILADWLLVPWRSIPVYVNWWCFNFKVIADNWNWGNGNEPSNSSSSGGSSSGGGSSSRGSVNNNEELEFGWEVLEPQKAESCSIEWSTYSDEENQAYLWACEKWMILADNIMKANFSDPLTRAELDKMMSIYAKQLLWRNYVVNDTVSYPDVDNSLGDLPYYIQEWYKLQIMGIHANGTALSKFLPNLLVTRWEFATVFSRVLYGSVYNIDGANYYEKHLQVLKDAGILTNTNPSLVEVRGWVVVMLYRSQKVEESNWSISNEEVAEITWD